jgi:molecular chaperone GrpE
MDEHIGSTPEAPKERRVKITDKRRQATASGEQPEAAPVLDVDPTTAQPVVEGEVVESSADEAVRDYLDDLRRLQADFDNYRKRMMRDQAAVGDRAKAELVARLLPVLDNFERALDHDELDPESGIALIFKELQSILKAEGLEEIPALDQPFDPTVHEAVMSNDNESVEEPTVSEVYRTGYSFKGSVVRPAMVVVARPGENVAANTGQDG